MNDAPILIVDDERAIIHLLVTVLRKEGFTHIDTAGSAEEAEEACARTAYALIILDVMLPGRSGVEICPFLRQKTDAPILFLSARTSDYDKLTGFAVGGDDYIAKPFNPLEVVARIRSQLRRHLRHPEPASRQQATSAEDEGAQVQPAKVYDYGRFQVDEQAGELRVGGKTVACPALVFQLLLFLCKHPNRLFTKSELYERVWGEDSWSDDNTVMVHIHRIRERIEENPSSPQYLVNVRGLGYKLVRHTGQSQAESTSARSDQAGRDSGYGSEAT
ncbi:response regulator transcription factor [Paenibacillus tarimensis]|uniref:response regulator transcription factor n=1 Tax=Paenibacillus tarimensis TaxID=416012 RepID=UPI001F48F656|nr:response regulator transcription factor [Paenibacillus tarimensis]MCF2943524.1 response regulator transcription factor [Paenibacillus tarimensis]